MRGQQPGRQLDPDGLRGLPRQAGQLRHRQGESAWLRGASASQKQPAVAPGGQQEACLASTTPPPGFLGGLEAAGGLTGCLPQVVCVFRMESAAPKAPAGEGEEAESNSVESLGFCNV